MPRSSLTRTQVSSTVVPNKWRLFSSSVMGAAPQRSTITFTALWNSGSLSTSTPSMSNKIPL